jgi:hypothetical protein
MLYKKLLMSKKKSKKNKPEVHNELKGFDIKINEFGEITSSMEIDQLNEFLDENVEDKKLKELEQKNNSEEEDKEEDETNDEDHE